MNTLSLQTTAVRLLEVRSEEAGQRIDNFLLRHFKGVPKSVIYRILRKGEVRVNRARTRPDYRLQMGDKIRIPPVRVPDPETSPRLPRPLLAQLKTTILYEDQDILIINKPPGIAVHKGSGIDFGIIEALRNLRPDLIFLQLAHRLDRDTSGCLLLAKNASVLRTVHAQLQAGQVQKRYFALVKGHWRHGTLELSVPLRKSLRGGERMVKVTAAGKAAKTRFKPLRFFPQASLLEACLATGRTHQIRVHANYLEHPLAGDDKYGDGHFNRTMAGYGLNRLFLHAHSLTLRLGGQTLAVSAPLHPSLKHVLDQLEKRHYDPARKTG